MHTDVFDRADLQRVDRIWADYQSNHDVSAWHGQAVGVDPDSGEVFFGQTAGDIMDRLREEGRFRILLYWRVGYPYYSRERGRKRWSSER